MQTATPAIIMAQSHQTSPPWTSAPTVSAPAQRHVGEDDAMDFAVTIRLKDNLLAFVHARRHLKDLPVKRREAIIKFIFGGGVKMAIFHRNNQRYKSRTVGAEK